MEMTFKQAYLYDSFEEFIKDRYAISYDITVVDLKSWLNELGIDYRKSLLKQQLIELLVSNGITPIQFYEKFPAAFYVIKSDYVNRFNLSDSEYNKLKKHLLEVAKVKSSYSSRNPMCGFDVKQFFEMTDEKLKEFIPSIDVERSERQKQARIKALTCVECGDVQSSYKYISKEKVCVRCEELKAEKLRRKSFADKCQKLLLSENCVILDTETTGLDWEDQVIELAIVSMTGETLYHSLFNTDKEISNGAMYVHGITQECLSKYPTFKDEWSKIKSILDGKVLLIYNSKFDIRLLNQTLAAYDIDDFIDNPTQCIMLMFADYIDSRRWVKLIDACGIMDLEVYQTHRATDDCLLVLELIKAIAKDQA